MDVHPNYLAGQGNPESTFKICLWKSEWNSWTMTFGGLNFQCLRGYKQPVYEA